MFKVKKVLAVINDIESMEPVLKKGIALASTESAFLEVMFVHETPIFDRVEYFRFKYEAPLEGIDREKVRLEVVEKLGKLNAPIDTPVEVFLDDTVDQVLKVTKCETSMVILIGHNNLIAKQLVQESHLPVLVLKNSKDHIYKNIVVPFDFSEASKTGVDLALKLFDKSLITLVHDFRYLIMEDYIDPEGMVLPYFDMEIGDAEEKAQRNELLSYAQSKGVNSRFIIQEGSIVDDLINDIKNNDVDLVVSGSEDANRLFFRSVALEILSDTSTDILVYAPK